MLKRKMYDYLLNWKKTKSKECLLIKGARQVGKTYLVRQFGKAEYESFIEINFHMQSSLKVIFEGDRSAEEIYKRITANIPAIRLIPGKTLIFLDEIQKCADARTALKFLAEDGRYDVIASGSLLGLSYGQDDDREVKEVESIPVGYEKSVMMYSLDFEEFLWAYGYEADTIDYLRSFYESKEKIPPETNQKFDSILREYIVVGGMPEVVADFMEHKDFGRVQEIQDKLIASYADDISQHAKGAEKVKVRKCYDSIPRQLAKENKKFKYSEVESKATARKFGDSIQWLSDANMAYICCNTTTPMLPLNAYEKDNEFKLYINDTGLLLALFGFATKQALLNGNLKGFAKGGIYENFVAETLIKNGYSLHYYKPDDNSELEFIIEKDGEVIPIEVKAGNTATKSLNSFIENYSPSIAYKLVSGNVGEADGKITLPHYLTMFI
ncbi:MAG: ATP-binding protein [Ruminococcus sp.]|nr:ATP-binding protein [Oscillospiraceae bacterium]MBP3309966.1 ATP-binding protein [Ruminococcus sp.]